MMTGRNLTSGIQSQISGTRLIRGLLVEIYFDSGVEYHTDFMRDVSWGGNTYAAGLLLDVDGISESLDGTIASVAVTLSGATLSNVSSMLIEEYMDRKVVVYEAIFDTNYQLVSDPFIKFLGYINVPEFMEDPIQGQSTVTWHASSQLVKFDRLAGRTTSIKSQQVLFPDDLFFDYALKVNPNVAWGGATADYVSGVSITPVPGAIAQINKNNLQSNYGAAVNIPVIYGAATVGGIQVFQAISGDFGQHFNLVFVWCEGEIEAVDEIYINDVAASDPSWSGKLLINHHLGADDQAADADLIAEMAAYGGLWTSAHQGKGIAYSYIRISYQARQSTTPTIKADLRGKKVYEVRQNLLTYSEQFDNAVWLLNAGASITADDATDPTGGSTADTLGGLSDGNQYLIQYASIAPANKTFTSSIWLKGSGTVNLGVYDGLTAVKATMVTLGASWTRYSYTAVYDGSSTATRVGLIVQSSDGATATSIQIWGAQLEQASAPGGYKRTTSTAVSPGDVFSDNAALVLRDYISNERYGLGLTSADINDASYGLAAAYCDTQRETFSGSGVYQSLFAVDGVVDTSRQVRDNINDMLRHCMGAHVFPDGKFNLWIEKAETPAFTFSVDNIIGKWTVTGADKRQRFNRVEATFYDASNGYQSNTAVYDSSTFRTQDNGLLLVQKVDLPYCNDPYRAQNLSELYCRKSRLNWTVSFTATIEALKCVNGQVVYLTHPTPGWSSKAFRIQKIALQPDGNVQVDMLEYDGTIYDLSANVEIVAPSDTTLPDPNSVAAPTGLTLASGTAYLVRNAAGLVTRIYASWTAPGDAYVTGYELQNKKSSDSAWIPAAAPSSSDTVSAFIAPVIDGEYYDVRVRSVNAMGRVSAWLTTSYYQVVGQSEAPPDVDTFSVLRQTDGTRQFSWTYSSPPIDFQSGGFEIRYKLGTGGTWGTMTALHTGLLAAAPYETNALAAGTYTFGIKAVDSTGNYSTNAKIIEATLDDPRLADSVVSLDVSLEGWTGTKTSCHVAPDGTLEADDSTTWNDLPATWTDWTSWNMSPAASFTYVEEIDIGSIITCTPLATASSASDVTLELSYSGDGSTWTAYAALGATVTARYLRIRATVAQHASEIPILAGLHINVTAKTIDEDINDLDISTLTGSYRIGTGDVRLPITKTYVVIKQIALVFQGISVGDIWTASIKDKNVSPGPRVQFFKNGALADPPLIDAYVKGV